MATTTRRLAAHALPVAMLATMTLLALAPEAARAQRDPCLLADTTAWDPGPGWETIGNCRAKRANRFSFDIGGTLFTARGDIDTLDTTGGWPGVWRRIEPIQNTFMDYVFPLMSRDSLLGDAWHQQRSLDRGWMWHPTYDDSAREIIQMIPAGALGAGRLFASITGQALILSDTRGGSWRPPSADPGGYPRPLQNARIAAYPAADGPWGAGRPGRTLAGVSSYGVAFSDDAGETWRWSGLHALGTTVDFVAVLARPLAEGGGLRAVALGEINGGGSGCVRVWTSDDAGDTWTQRELLCEPCEQVPGCPQAVALVPLSQRQHGYAPPREAALTYAPTEWQTSEALAVLGRGGVFRTRDGGATWTREPGPAGQVPLERPWMEFINSATLGPDGRLYVSVTRQGPEGAWAVRTASGFLVGDEAPPEASPPGGTLHVAVVPNPSRSEARVTVEVPAPTELRVAVVDARGREVARLHDGPAAAGPLALSADVRALAAGVYVVRAEAGIASATATLTVVR